MAVIGNQTSFINGISFSDKEGPQNSVAFTRAIDHRSDPKKATLNPASLKDTGSLVTDLPMWGARACDRTFAYGDTGKIYQEDSGWTVAHTAANSQGNGLEYFTADKALYYAQNTTFGRLIDACTGSVFTDNFLGSEGGEPTNTKSLVLNGTTQYAYCVDSASLSITSDLTLEPYIKPTVADLPTGSDTQTLMSKWDENGDLRSYKLDITAKSNFFGDGSDGALTIATNTTDTPIDSSCAGTISTYALTATNTSFASGQKIMIWQVQGTNVGMVQYTSIASYTAGTITTNDSLDISFSSTGDNSAQVIVMKQYTNVTVNSSKTWTAKAWNGTVGGVIAFFANGTVTVTGTISALGKGFRGGTRGLDYGLNETGLQGENETGTQSQSTSANGIGGGGGGKSNPPNGGGNYAGGGGHATGGVTGVGADPASTQIGGTGGGVNGATDISNLFFGGGGGGGGSGDATGSGGDGANGGGCILIFGKIIAEVTGLITTYGATADPRQVDNGGGGQGAGGSILLKCQTSNLGSSNEVIAIGSPNKPDNFDLGQSGGGGGGTGFIHVDYLTSVTGDTSPDYTSAEDSTLGSSEGNNIRLQISDDGIASESYAWDITDYATSGDWFRPQVKWDASLSTAEAFVNGKSFGTKIGSMTTIDDNASKFAIGVDFDSSGDPQNFYSGKIDDPRLFNDLRTDSELLNNNDQILLGTEANQIAYYEFEDDLTDSQTSGNNDLTGAGTPTYSTDVPFSGLTARNDQDQSLTTGSFTEAYTLTTGINEGATHRQTFVPTRDPQKSILVDIDTIGTGDWTLTVHDSLNREVTSVTVVAANLNTSYYEFIFASVWRPIIGATYHFHLTSTVADGKVDTTGADDLETAYFITYYQFLVSDEYHPMKEYKDFMVIGNERYLAKYQAGGTYEPHKLTFPPSFRVRSLAYWGDYIAIGCWKGTAITDYDSGYVFIWDGVNDTYIDAFPVPEGGVNAMFGTNDVLFLVAGYLGEILIYAGGGSAGKFNRIPKLDKGKYIEVAPGSMNMWRSNIHMGVGINTDSELVHKGVYSIGSSNMAYTASLGFDYPLSLGDQTASTVKTSMVYPSGQDLFIGWQNGNAYGIDKINPSNDVYKSGTIELLISDLGTISKEKYPLIIRTDFEALNSGESVRVKYIPDRASVWKYDSTNEGFEDTVNAMESRYDVGDKCKEIQVAVDLKTTVSTSPNIIGVTLESDLADGGINA